AMISFFLVYRKNYRGASTLSKELAIIGIAVVAFLFCFLGIGIINGKIGSDTSFLNVLAHYAGTNISAFDVYINEMLLPDTPYIGTTTLDPIYIFLNNHGFAVPRFYQYITLFTIFGPVTTNVYTVNCKMNLNR
ncbi:MAG: oligosaccharide repeat unit polymerase, partial [Megasphaera elsdenii]|nr:oligosaccharide repeat unit polymerase [Megasphaera elsdenii]